jgi:filamentous hemagglutinin
MISTASPTQHPAFKPKILSACIRLALAGGVLAGYMEQVQAASPALPILPVPAGKDFVKFGKADIGIKGGAMNIKQHSDKAILHWNSFNIGAKNQVNFQQPKTTSIALNKIFQNNPSQILGQLKANGQVYLVNQNGFVFGKNASVNVHTLIATSLDVKDDVFKGAGITKVISQSDDSKGALPALEGTQNPNAKISVETGAVIQAGQGGRVILAGPEVKNAGEIKTDKNGQIMLIGSQDKVYLAEKSCSGSTEATCDFNGLLVEVGTGGKVTNANLGKITARQGDVTLAGFAVNQEGRVTATTSSKVNGSIHLQARQGVDATNIISNKNLDSKPSSGTVRSVNGKPENAQVKFGVASLTEIGIDEEDAVSVDEQTQPQSTVTVSANTIVMERNAQIHAPGAKVDFVAAGNPNAPTKGEQEVIDEFGTTQAKALEGKIILNDGAKIDVSGSKNIKTTVSRNIVDVPVQSFELRNSPFQKGGVLQGKTIKVDIRHKPAIVDISGAEKRIERSTEERLGRQLTGQVNLTAAGEVKVNPGAKIDISGGKVSYQGGNIETTHLMTDNGRIVDISEADPSQHYKSVLGFYEEVHQKWGVTKVWQSGLSSGQSTFEPGYLEGLRAGELNIHTPKLFWQGELLAGSVSGPYQREDEPFGGKWTINNDLSANNYDATQSDDRSFIPRQNIRFQSSANKLHITSTSHQVKPDEMVLDAEMINRSGIQDITVKTAGNASIDANTKLELPVKSHFELVARNLDLAGKIHTPGGSVNLAAGWNQADKDISADPVTFFGNASSPLTAKDGQLTMYSRAEIDVSGRWVNDYATSLSGALPSEPLAIEGGAVNLTSGISGINLLNDSAIKVDGGARLSDQQTVEPGKGGRISFQTHRLQLADANGLSQTIYPELQLKGNFSAYSLNQGGELTVKQDTDNFVIGKPDSDDIQEHRFVLPVADNNLKLQGINGFSQINLENSGIDLTLKKSTVLDLRQQNYLLTSNYQQFASVDSLNAVSIIQTLPEYLRKPVNLKLSSNKHLVLETGSKILADPLATISLESAGTDGNTYIDGSITAPGGNININSRNPVDVSNYYPHHIWLGSHADLNVAGSAILKPLDSLGRRTGEVLAGGTISLLAGDLNSRTAAGHVIIEKGAAMNASGTQATLNLPDNGIDGAKSSPVLIGSDGGSINIRASESVVLDGDLTAKAGSSTSSGGSLNIQFVDYLAPGTSQTHDIVISQNYQEQLGADDRFEDIASNQKFIDPSAGLVGKAALGANQLTDGGFSELKLFTKSTVAEGEDTADSTTEGKLTFLGDVNLKVPQLIELDTPKIVWSSAEAGSKGKVTLNTGFLKAGSSLYNKISAPPAPGDAVLTANTQWTEFNGASSWSGFSALNFNSRQDTRTVSHFAGASDDFRTQFNSAGDINLTASQVYPTTLSNFSFNIDATAIPNGKISVANSGLFDETPLSAGGTLDFNAPVILQKGTIKAPFGKISLTAAQSLALGKGSLTSVSGAELQVPFGNMLNGQNWVYPELNTQTQPSNELISAPPQKKLTLNAPDIRLEKGSTVDLSGGGDLLAAEFQPGIGGEFNYLGSFKSSDVGLDNPAYKGGFAVLPGLKSALAPYDPLHKKLGNYRYETGQKIYLSGSDKLAEGYYTILPARYALMPGGLLVTPQADTQDQRITGYTASGLPVVTGYLADAATAAREQRWSGYQIEDGKDIRMNAQYDERGANAFFTQKATKDEKPVPILPRDSGQIVIKGAKTRLALEGDFKVKPDQKGRSARMDIAGEQLDVVSKLGAGAATNGLQIVAENLNHLGVGSLLLGGERSIDPETGTTNLAVSAKEVTIGNGAALTGTDLIIAAQDKISVLASAKLQASGQVNTGDNTLRISNVSSDPSLTTASNDGALLRLSADNQVNLIRANAPGDTGELNIEKGASLSASKSMFLDASGTASLAGDIAMKGGSLNLSANAVNLGEVDNLPASSGLSLSNNDLAKLKVDEFILSSRGALNMYGDVGFKDSTGQYQPLNFDKLVINVAGINGFGGTSKLAQINAKELQLQNLVGAPLPQSGTGKGKLIFTADNFSQGRGKFDLSGFSSVGVNAVKAFKAAGNGELNVAGNLNLSAGYLTSAPGVSLDINASGVANFNPSSAKTALPAIEGFGGTLKVTAASIGFNATAILPSGTLDLQSTNGNTEIRSNTQVDLAGRKVVFGDTADFTKGGELKVASDKGGIIVAKGAAIDMRSGGGEESGGKLDLRAATNLNFAGDLKAQGGSAAIDVGKFSGSKDFDNLLDKLMSAGVSDELSVRARQGNIQQGNDRKIAANAIKLAADTGNMIIGGKLDADGKTGGGSVDLYAGDRITLEKDADISAKGIAPGAKGGNVRLSATDTDQANDITINKGALIDVSGGANGEGGEVTLRALRKGSDNIAIDKINGDVKGVSHFYAEGVKIYSNDPDAISSGATEFSNDPYIDISDIDKLKSDTDAYMAAGTMLKVANTLGKGVQLRPGVEIDYKGDLTLKDEWDLLNWRYPVSGGRTPVAGNLSIRASGNMTFSNSLTDGFKTTLLGTGNATVFDEFGNPAFDEFFNPILASVNSFQDNLQLGQSWSYQITVGADLAAADNASVGNTAKDLTINQKSDAGNINPLNQDLRLLSTVIRTGTGNIQVDSSGDVVFGTGQLLDSSGQSIVDPTQTPLSYTDPISVEFVVKPKAFTYSTSIYTAGSANNGAPYFGSDPLVPAGYADYSKEGGNITVKATNDIKGSLYQKPTIKDWLVVQGISTGADDFGNPLPNTLTTWGVDFAKFGQNIGAFGGGSVDIKAGNNIDDLTVMAPSSGKQISTDKVQIEGADRFQVSAGGDIKGGIYLQGKGRGSLAADGAISGSRGAIIDSESDPNPTTLESFTDLTGGPQLLLGDTNFKIAANRGIAITGVNDPIVVDTDGTTKFFSSGLASSLGLKSLAGDIKLASDTNIIGGINPNTSSSYVDSSYFPASLSATAFIGSIVNNTNKQGGLDLTFGLNLLPSFNGNLAFLAGNGIDTNITMSDFDPALLPTALNPIKEISRSSLPEIDPESSGTSNLNHAQTPVHRGDQNPVHLYAKSGDIDGGYNFTKKALVSAGRDIKDVTLKIQHANLKDDVSIISAGRDINFNGVPQAIDGVMPPSGGIEIRGSGEVLVTGGRNIDLSTSGGIVTTGNQNNPNLPESGANLIVAAGLQNTQPNYLGFEQLDSKVLDYAENYNKYQDKVIELMRNRTGNTKMTAKTAFEQFAQLSDAEKVAFDSGTRGLLSNKYHNIIGEIKQRIVEFVRTSENNPALTEVKALEHFRLLKSGEYLPVQAKLESLAQTLLFTELNATGSASAADPTVGNKRGYDAINALFPGIPGQSGSPWQGDISLAFSQIKTEKGGNINLLAPGGNVDVGLPVPGVNKKSEELGVIARGAGNVNIFLDGDLNVNQSRVFALGGGDISVWSSHGDIDAGRGAKSAFAVADPKYSFDANGNLIVEFLAPVAGSGIRTSAPPAGNAEAGDVGLYAPGGVVNAAEAGIGGNNVTISATAVLGAGNIQVGGVATGVPAATTVSLAAGLTGVGNVAANATQAAEASANMNKDRMDDAKNGSHKQLGTISVELLGFGA